MTLDEFRRTLSATEPPPALTHALAGLSCHCSENCSECPYLQTGVLRRVMAQSASQFSSQCKPNQARSSECSGHVGRVRKGRPGVGFTNRTSTHTEAPRTQVRNLEGMRQKSPDEGSGIRISRGLRLCQIESTLGLSSLNVFFGGRFHGRTRQHACVGNLQRFEQAHRQFHGADR